jgi:hypothetical protein
LVKVPLIIVVSVNVVPVTQGSFGVSDAEGFAVTALVRCL